MFKNYARFPERFLTRFSPGSCKIFPARAEAGIVHKRFVKAGICEGTDKAESDCDSEDDPLLIFINSRCLTCTTLVHGT